MSAPTGGGVEVMWEWWSTRWYTPLLAIGALVAALLVAGVAVIGMVAAEDSSAVAPGRDPVELARVRSAVDRWATTPPGFDRRDPTPTGGSHDR